jgi:hypothetical protein
VELEQLRKNHKERKGRASLTFTDREVSVALGALKQQGVVQVDDRSSINQPTRYNLEISGKEPGDVL